MITDETKFWIETIECPECRKVQEAKSYESFPWNISIHQCVSCGYTIMESEWNKVNMDPREIENPIAEEDFRHQLKLEKAKGQATIIKIIASYLPMLDFDFCEQAARDMMQQANRQETLAILNPNYPQIKNEILRKQGQALQCLCLYARTLQEVNKLQENLTEEEKARTEISKLFI